MRTVLSSALVLAMLPLACTRGSGVQASEVRTVEGFESIDVESAVVVTVEIGPETRVEVRGDDNIVPTVRTEVVGQTLHIGINGSIAPSLPLTVEVATPSLHELGISGASTATVRGIEGERFEVDLSGASTAELVGTVVLLDAEISGASTLRAHALSAESAEVDVSGASNAEVEVTQSLDADASGASTIRYHGNPDTVARDASGASKIKPAG